VGQQTCWLGSLRNQVRGSLTYAHDVTSDPDGMEIDNNLMGGNMTCLNNDPAVQYGDSGAAPNLVGSRSFIAYDSCDSCSFGGQTGTTTLRFFGKTTARGVTSGTFLVTAGGTGTGLPTLAGWGTFTSAGQPSGTWRLVEHLRNT
jgi:hypothetical protein